jgi:choline dehydrogenase
VIVFQVKKEFYTYQKGLHGFTAMIFLTRPVSTGYVKLKSKHPDEDPLIHPNYLADDDDVKRFLEGAFGQLTKSYMPRTLTLTFPLRYHLHH